MNENPWGLSPRVSSALDAVLSHGSEKVAAAKLGVTPRVLDGRVRLAKEAMGVTHRIHAVVCWDRWKRGAE